MMSDPLSDAQRRCAYFENLYRGASAGNRSSAKGIRRLKAKLARRTAELYEARRERDAARAALGEKT